jgi:Cft2 family RNA processing exonuclease
MFVFVYFKGLDAQPFFDEVDADKVDLILITHFHIDHCAALPYFTEKTNFKVHIHVYIYVHVYSTLFCSGVNKLVCVFVTGSHIYDSCY